jgi:hypothetical protein
MRILATIFIVLGAASLVTWAIKFAAELDRQWELDQEGDRMSPEWLTRARERGY